jgi:predicted nucleic acid-binding protein
LEEVRAVLDTNVLVGKYRQPLLAAAGLGIYELILSPYILDEVGEVLDRVFGVPAEMIANYLARLEDTAAIVDESVIEGGNYDEWLHDPDDHPVMATAIAGRADYLVTANTSDFPPKHRFAGTTLITPAAFAERMGIGLV